MRLEVELEGERVPVVMQSLRGVTWLHVDGETFVLESESGAGGKKIKAAGGGDLVAPMPGKVTKLLRKQGDIVAEGDVLVVMEAMKMEYSLKSAVAGVVEKMNCAVGDQVVLGKVLSVVKPAKENA